MIAHTHKPLVASLKRFSLAASVIVISLGYAALIGWAFEIPILSSGLPGMTPTPVGTAISFILAGVALGFLQREEVSGWKRRAVQLSAFTVCLIGLLALSKHLFGWDIGIDRIFVNAYSPFDRMRIPFLPRSYGGFNFVLIGFALFLFDHKTRRGHWPAQWLVLTAAIISVSALVGYVYGATFFSEKLAFLSAVSFSFLCAGLFWVRPDRGQMALVTADTTGGAMLRRLFPAAILMPLLFVMLTETAERAGFFTAETAAAFAAILNILFFSTFLFWNARSLHQGDIERKRAEEQTAQLAAIVDTAEDAIIGKTLEGIITSWNRGAEHLYGYKAQEVIGKPISILVPPEHPDELPHLLEKLKHGERIEQYETTRLRKDGGRVPVAIAVSPVINAAGQMIGASAVARDITERKRTQETLARHAAELAAANKELESFSYSVSHDLRAPLRAIDGFGHAMEEDCAAQLDACGKDHLLRIRAATQGMGRLIDDLLNLSRLTRSEMRREKVNLSELAQQIVAALQESEPQRRVEVRIAKGLNAVGDPNLLRVVLQNLLANAWKFSNKQPLAHIELGASHENRKAVFFVRDNGAGFDMAYTDKLFGAFQRLHGANEFPGSGVGLATVQRIIHRHGGRIWAEAAVGKGATFYFTLEPERKS